jgi:hypothetical protein
LKEIKIKYVEEAVVTALGVGRTSILSLFTQQACIACPL